MNTVITMMPRALCILCSVVMLLAGCTGSREPTSRAELEREFEMLFDFKPTSDVSDLKCKIVNVGDGAGKWMTFDCAENTFQRITKSLKEVARENIDAPELPRFTSENENPNAPKWWPKSWVGVDTIYYVSKPYEAGVRHESMYLYVWRDLPSGKVYGHLVAWH